MNNIDDFTLELGQGSELGMMVILGLMMFSVALGLRAEHFRFFRDQPLIYFGGVASQLIGLPLITLGLCLLLQPTPSVALGMILIACCPGGNVSNLLVVLARGNAALSVSLTATSSLSAAFVTPLSIVFWCSLYAPTSHLLTEINFDTVSFFKQTSFVLVLPIFAGMATIRFWPKLAAHCRVPLIAISGIGLLIIICGTFVKYSDQFMSVGLPLIGLVAVHNAVAFLLGYLTAMITRADVQSLRALTFEVGIQNSGLGIVILLTQLGGLGGAAAVAGLWGFWHILAGLILVALFRKHPC